MDLDAVTMRPQPRTSFVAGCDWAQTTTDVTLFVALPADADVTVNGGSGGGGGGAAAAAAGGAGENGGGGGGGGNNGRAARRSSRSSAGSSMSVSASSTCSVLHLKMLLYQSAEWYPSQQRLFVDGVELADDDKTLAEAAVLPNSTLHVFIDTSRPEELPELDDAIGGGGAAGGKQRAPEDGFVGSALVSSSFGAPRSSTPAAADGADAAAGTSAEVK